MKSIDKEMRLNNLLERDVPQWEYGFDMRLFAKLKPAKIVVAMFEVQGSDVR